MASAFRETEEAAQLERDAGGAAGYPSPLAAGITLLLLVLAILFAYVDRQVVSVLVTPIKAAMGLSDTQVGMLHGLALTVSAGVATLALGLLIDRSNRTRLIAFSAVAWSIFTALSGLCGGFWQLFLCRMGVGVAEAGLAPAAYSLIADLYRPGSRPTATFVFLLAGQICGGAAFMLLGAAVNFLSRHASNLPVTLSALPDWRLSFLAAALPGLLIGLFFLLTVEPSRKSSKPAMPANVPMHEPAAVSLGRFLSANWVMLTCLCVGFNALLITVDAFATWIPTILSREYSLTPAEAGTRFGPVMMFGGVLGILLSAALRSILSMRSKTFASLWVLQIGTALTAAILPCMFLPQTPGTLLGLVALYVVAYFLAGATYPTMLLEVTPNHLRGRLYGIGAIIGIVGASVCPVLIGRLSDRIFHGPTGLKTALLATTLTYTGVALIAVLAVTRPFGRSMRAFAAAYS